MTPFPSSLIQHNLIICDTDLHHRTCCVKYNIFVYGILCSNNIIFDANSSQDNKNTQSYKIVAVEQTRTSTDVILEGISRDAGAKRTTLDTTVCLCVSSVFYVVSLHVLV